MRLADRILDFKATTSLEVMQKSREMEARGVRVVHFEVGEPDFDTPAHVVQALERSIEAGETHYGPPPGMPELRRAIAEDSTQRLGVAFAPDEVIVTHGAKPVMIFALLTCVNPGDEVLIPDPGYTIYPTLVRLLGATPVVYGFDANDRERLDLAALRASVTPRTRMIMLNSPGNPTGVVHSEAELTAIRDLAVEHDLWVVSDEIYSRIVYEGRHISIASIPGMKDRTIVLDGFSKGFAMTGWRLGYALAPREIAARFALLMTHTTTCVSTFVQRGGLAALTGGDGSVRAMVEQFRARRAHMMQGLAKIPGLRCARPSGAFYLFPDMTPLGLTTAALTDRLLAAGVAVVPGTSFGARGEGHVRISFAASLDAIDEGLSRIAAVAAAAPGAA